MKLPREHHALSFSRPSFSPFMAQSDLEWIYIVPILLVLGLNTFFLVWIMWVSGEWNGGDSSIKSRSIGRSEPDLRRVAAYFMSLKWGSRAARTEGRTDVTNRR